MLDDETDDSAEHHTHFGRLLRSLYPYPASVRQLEADAGLKKNFIAYYMKPSTDLVRMPKATVVLELARALNCDPGLVIEAFAKDVGLPIRPHPYPPEAREVLHVLAELSPVGQRAVMLMARSLLAAERGDAST